MAKYQSAIFLSLVAMCSQALILPKMIGHSPDMMKAPFQVKVYKMDTNASPLGCMREIFLIVSPGMDREGLTRW